MTAIKKQRLLEIKFGNKTIKAKVIDMQGLHIFRPYFLACSHHQGDYVCDKGPLGFDDRVCCSCEFYDGGSIVALDWGSEINFVFYPFNTQNSLKQTKYNLEEISRTKQINIINGSGEKSKEPYEIKIPILT